MQVFSAAARLYMCVSVCVFVFTFVGLIKLVLFIVLLMYKYLSNNVMVYTPQSDLLRTYTATINNKYQHIT